MKIGEFMDQIDNDFFEAYKHLEKLCGEIYCCSNGISEYISEMETKPRGQSKVESWFSDYKSLKHVRWVRNQIAHDTSDYVHSDYNDLEFTELFYNRIMNQEDPLAQLRKIEQRCVTSHNASKRIPDTSPNYPDASANNYSPNNLINDSRTKHFGKIIWIIALVILIILLFVITR